MENLENQKIHISLQRSKITKNINRSIRNNKIKKLWQQQIGQLSEEKKQVTKC